ncbi:MAG: hypothetical protein ACK41E_00830 [Deinococcales bacterium]
MKKVFLTALVAAFGVAVVSAQQPTGTLEARLITRLDFSSFGDPAKFNRSQFQFGDLDNDGKSRDFIRYTNSRIMQAFTWGGAGQPKLLWEFKNSLTLPQPPDRYHYKYVIWDIDSDGKTEVIGAFAATNGNIEVRILEGMTGKVKHAFPTQIKNPTKDDPVRETRIKFAVANLRGTGVRDILMLTEFDSMGDIWAFDSSLKLLWDTTADNNRKTRIYGHFPWTGDINNDGKEEVIGSFVRDGTSGKELFRVTPGFWAPADVFFDHLDRVFVGDLDPTRPGAEIAISHEYNEVSLLDRQGRVYWDEKSLENDSKLNAVGEFDPKSPGVEFMTLDPRDPTVGQIYSSGGVAVGRVMKGRKLGAVKLAAISFDGYPIDWDGDRTTDEVFQAGEGVVMQPSSGRGVVLRELYAKDAKTPVKEAFPVGRIWGQAFDITLDAREEAIVWDNDEMLIYGAPGRPSRAYGSLWRHPEYRLAVANTMNDNHPERRYLDFRALTDFYKSRPAVQLPANPLTTMPMMQAFVVPEADASTDLRRAISISEGKLQIRVLRPGNAIPATRENFVMFAPISGSRGAYTFYHEGVLQIQHRAPEGHTLAKNIEFFTKQLAPQGIVRGENTLPADDATSFSFTFKKGDVSIPVKLTLGSRNTQRFDMDFNALIQAINQ